MNRTFTLVTGDGTSYGAHEWDTEKGEVTSGFMRVKLNEMGSTPWYHAGMGIGSSEPALKSVEGMVAMLLLMGFQQPPELQLKIVPEDNTDQNALN